MSSPENKIIVGEPITMPFTTVTAHPTGHATEESISANIAKGRSDAINARAHLMVSVQDIGECLSDLALIMIQGPNELNAAKRGGIAVGLRKAAWRIEHGTLAGFDPTPAKPFDPTPLYEILADCRKIMWDREILSGDAFDMIMGRIDTVLLPKRAKTME
jgi:hypothetical protein